MKLLIMYSSFQARLTFRKKKFTIEVIVKWKKYRGENYESTREGGTLTGKDSL